MLETMAQNPAAMDQLLNFGAAGLMGAMWLWERRTSRQREQQLDEAHARILSDGVQLDELIQLVRLNTQTMTRLCAMQEQLLRRLSPAVDPAQADKSV